jgi:AraC family transcriptional regulator
MVSSEATPWHGALLRRWRGTSAEMVQPPLDHHYVVVHLGGPKRVTRHRDGPAVANVAERGSLTLVPAGTQYVWRTEGPIAFAHLYIRPEHLASADGLDLTGGTLDATLAEKVACRDPLLESPLEQMLAEVHAGGDASPLRLDSLFERVLSRLARAHCSRRAACRPNAPTLAGHQLRRVVDFIEAHLAQDISLADLAAVARSSVSHFSHAFQAATGKSPYRYVTERRVELAQVLLLAGDEPLEVISKECGFNSRRQFTTMFKSQVGTGPRSFRLAHRSPFARRGDDGATH